MKANPLPPIVIGMQDYCDLMGAAGVGSRVDRHQAEFLHAELRRAVIAHPCDVPADVISINSRVTYRLDGKSETQTRVLVHADHARWPSAELSVMTPLGTALLGLSVGDSMPFRARDGQRHEVLVEDVGFARSQALCLTSASSTSSLGRPTVRRLQRTLKRT